MYDNHIVRKARAFMEKEFGLFSTGEQWQYFHNPFKEEKDREPKMHVHLGYAWVKDWRSSYSAPLTSFLSDYCKAKYQQADKWREGEEREDYFVEHRRIKEEEKRQKRRKVAPEAKSFSLKQNEKDLLGFLSTCTSLLEKECKVASKARDYLVSRKCDVGYCHRRGWMVCADETNKHYGYMLIPCMVYSQLDFIVCRDILFRSLEFDVRYRNIKSKNAHTKPLYNEQGLWNEKKVYVCEGIFDAVVFGDKGIATMGKNITLGQINTLLLSPVKEIVFVPDKGCYDLWHKEAMRLLRWKEVSMISLDKEEGKDASEVGIERLLALEGKAKPLRLFERDGNKS